MRSERSQEGYLLIDHSASPGTKLIPGGVRFEAPTKTCGHCNSVVIINPDRQRERGHCFKCDHYICDQCMTGDCNPFEKKLLEAITNG